MPYYKKELFVEQSIKSILNQSYKNLEIILINDDVKNKYFINKLSKLDHRIKLSHNSSNIGAGLSRNRGVKLSKGEYIAFCDCDDLWMYNKLDIQLKFMKHYNHVFSFTSYNIIDEHNNLIHFRKAPYFINFKKLRNSCDIGLSTVMIKKIVFDNLYYKFPNLKTKEDYVLWLKLAKDKIKMKSLDQNLTSWRKTPHSLSSSILQKLIDGYKVYRVYLGYSRTKSFYCLVILSINFILKN